MNSKPAPNSDLNARIDYVLSMPEHEDINPQEATLVCMPVVDDFIAATFVANLSQIQGKEDLLTGIKELKENNIAGFLLVVHYPDGTNDNQGYKQIEEGRIGRRINADFVNETMKTIENAKKLPKAGM